MFIKYDQIKFYLTGLFNRLWANPYVIDYLLPSINGQIAKAHFGALKTLDTIHKSLLDLGFLGNLRLVI